MTSDRETLTKLVADALDDGLTYRALESRAVDHTTGYQAGRTTLWKVANGRNVILTPELVRAIATGLNIAPERAQRAAALQYAGYEEASVAGATVIRESGSPASGLDAERALTERWDEEAADDEPREA